MNQFNVTSCLSGHMPPKARPAIRHVAAERSRRHRDPTSHELSLWTSEGAISVLSVDVVFPHLSWLEAICHWWAPQAQRTHSERDIHSMYVVSPSDGGCGCLTLWLFSFCSRGRKDSLFIHLNCIIYYYITTSHYILSNPGAPWLDILSGIQPSLVISKVITSIIISALLCSVFPFSKAKLNCCYISDASSFL